MTETELVDIVKKQKNGKAAGVDGVKAEMMKQLIQNTVIRKALLEGFNHCLDENVNDKWLVSRTTMIPKNKKPKYKEHIPIAVTCLSSKIMCVFLREK